MPRRILLVEDERETREAVAETLAEAGYHVTAACTGEEAAILFGPPEDFDLLLTDIAMPGRIDGVALAEHAREQHPGLPVLFFSGRPEEAARTERVPPPRLFVPKPVDTRRLLGAVGQLVGG